LRVTEEDDGIRLDRWFRRNLPEIGFGQISRWARTGQLRLDGKRAAPGDRILAGHIRRGHFDTVRAVIWFSDLRCFTEMSSRASTREVIDTLNAVFECQVPAVEKHGGEVLKFMGDGLLAIFPIANDEEVLHATTINFAFSDNSSPLISAL